MAKRILVVDDEETVREIATAMLVSAGYECRMAGSGVGALALLEREEFDLLLTNLMMAEMDGFALLERTAVKYPRLPVVFETAVYDLDVALTLLLAGARDYVLKPFDQERICSAVHCTLETPCLNGESATHPADLEALVEARTEECRCVISNLGKLTTIKSGFLGNALDQKSGASKDSSMRVTAYTIALARRLGLPKEEVDVIARGAFLRDIGNMAIPDSILRKSGELTPHEVQIARRHCHSGYRILSASQSLAEAAEIVYAHHEHYDGSGYPCGLKGEEIPLGARLVAVAEGWDSITFDASSEAGTLSAAKEEMWRGSGRHFDPKIIQALLALPDDIWQRLSRDIGPQS
jgi:response regulator RpfG family c-di-GMP phosphodiesterase